jgi:hypothetical protein
MRYSIEKYYPVFFAVVIAALFYCYQKKIDNIDETVKKLLDSALAICGALLGFLLTILTLINTIDTRRMRFVKSGGFYPQLIRYLKIALFANLISISIYFFLPIIFSFKGISNLKDNVYTAIVFIISFTWVANIRFSVIFIRLMTDPKEH